jgi:class 3 adenylate cyclase
VVGTARRRLGSISTAGAELRQITVVAVDMHRSTAIAAQVGPETTRELMLEVYEVCVDAVAGLEGSAEHRIRRDDTGFANLYAVGDWTACGLNAGYVEGAVISGMLAANAIHRTYGDPAHVEPVIGLGSP